jgi:hypothetical protein
MSSFFSDGFLKAVESTSENDDKKLVIILGSGFHRRYLDDLSDSSELSRQNILYDWQKLLETAYDNYPFSGHYLTDFEDIVIKSTQGDNPNLNAANGQWIASEVEDQCLKRIQSKLFFAQEKVVNDYHNSVPVWLFNSEIVSDVISLNFALVPEMLVGKDNTTPKVKTNDELKFNRNVDITRHRTVEGIRFWHPHGDVGSYKSIVLSLRKYGLILQQVERLRTNFKSGESKKGLKETRDTWFDALARRPVLIIGASISQMEWDLWFALSNRRRNFAKPDNQKQEQPIFKMTGPSETLDTNWFTELTNRKETYPFQWEHLKDLFQRF